MSLRMIDEAEAQERLIKAITFRVAAERYIEAHEAGWRNAKHAAQWGSTLKAYAYVHFGEIPVFDIDVEHVLAALEPMWREKPETAVRLRGRIESILDYARTRDWRSGEKLPQFRASLGGFPRAPIARRMRDQAATPSRSLLPAYRANQMTKRPSLGITRVIESHQFRRLVLALALTRR